MNQKLLNRANKIYLQIQKLEEEAEEICNQMDLKNQTDDDLEFIAKHTGGLIRFACISILGEREIIREA